MRRTPAGKQSKNNLGKSLSCEPLSPNNERISASSLDGDVLSLNQLPFKNRSSLSSLDGAKCCSKTLLILLYRTRFDRLNLEARVPKPENAGDLVRLTGYQVLTARY